jgi:hypothetical protein
VTPAEELRGAATKLRETARGVTHFPTPWTVEPAEDDQWRVMYVKGNPLAGLIATTPDYGRVWLADWIALMHPGLAEPLALLLEDQAQAYENFLGGSADIAEGIVRCGLAVARVINGGA